MILVNGTTFGTSYLVVIKNEEVAHAVRGVLVDDMRRGGGFVWPPPSGDGIKYSWEASQGMGVAFTLMARLPFPGPSCWNWSDKAPLRVIKWLYDEAKAPGSWHWQERV